MGRHIVIAILVAASSYPCAAEQRIIHQSWTFKEGAPEAVEALAQTTDGYLWLGTPSGLFRFDGLRFELFRSPFGDQLPSTNVSALFAPAAGGLWVGYRFGGFSFVKNGKVTNFMDLPAPTGTVNGFAEDKAGVLWAATMGGVWRFDGSSWRQNPFGWNPKLRFVAQVGFDRDGTLWALTDTRGYENARELFSLRANGSKFEKAGDFRVESFTWDADYNVVTSNGRPVLKDKSEQIIDRSNGIWFLPMTGSGVYRHPASEPLADVVSTAAPENSQIYDLVHYRFARLVDREGNVWIGDPGGVHRFSYSPLMEVAIPKAPGPHFTMAPGENGAVWISSGDGNGKSALYRADGAQAVLHEAQGGVTNAACRGPDKTLWFAGEGGLWHMAGGRLTRVELPGNPAGGLVSMTSDAPDTLWVSFGPAGLFRFKDGVWTRDGGRRDLPASGVIIAYTDSSGRVWFGYMKNRLAVIDGDHVQRFGPQDGIEVGNVLAIYGRGSELWIGGEFGVQRFDHGRFQAIHAVDREWLRGISGIVQTAGGDLWLNGLGGIIHIPRPQITEALKNPGYRISGERFGRREGVPGLPSQLTRMPTAIEGTDGRLWFTVINGVVWIDPARASHRAAPAPVTIQSMSADGRSYGVDAPIRLPARTSDVQISYAAVSLADPEAIRFRYKIQEVDKDWHEAGDAKSVSYRNLDPGLYHFVVGASDTNGLWTGDTATAEFTVLPAFYQTMWFRALCLVLVLAMLWGAYQVRVRRLEREVTRLHDVIETIPTMAWTAYPDGSNAFVNNRWAEFTGLSREDTAGTGWMTAIHPDDLQAYREQWHACMANGEPFEFEVRFRCAGDGQYRWLLARGVPLRDGQGKILRWYGILTDIDDRKRAEQALKRTQSYLADAQRLTHSGAWASDPTTAPLYWSEGVFRAFGFDPQYGLPAREEAVQRIHPEDRDKFEAGFDKAIRRANDSEVEFRTVMPDGTVHHIQAIAHPILNAVGEVVEMVGTTVDITDRKRAEEERERLRQLESDLAHINRVSMMGELAASIAHEVNQPLTGIVSNGSASLRLLAGDTPNIAEAREALLDIVRDGKRAGEVIARIRSLTKRAVPPKEELDLSEIIGEVLALIGDRARKSGVWVQTRFQGEAFRVLADRVQMQQVLLNLIMNAIEAMSNVEGQRRRLVISADSISQDQVQVTVEDSGTGLAPDVLSRIFEPFYTTKASGMGMGLSICRSIVQSHGGRLWATGIEGPGTSFHFTLPRCHADALQAGAGAV